MIALSTGISVINYYVDLQSTKERLKKHSLPLTVDNIYTEIQKHIIEPNLVASMMAHDTFLKDWLLHDEKNVGKIAAYLETIKNKYGMFSAFLVSEKSGHYYSSKGLLETVSKDNPADAWYFRFKQGRKGHEINLDFNKHLDNKMITS